MLLSRMVRDNRDLPAVRRHCSALARGLLAEDAALARGWSDDRAAAHGRAAREQHARAEDLPGLLAGCAAVCGTPAPVDRNGGSEAA